MGGSAFWRESLTHNEYDSENGKDTDTIIYVAATTTSDGIIHSIIILITIIVFINSLFWIDILIKYISWLY